MLIHTVVVKGVERTVDRWSYKTLLLRQGTTVLVLPGSTATVTPDLRNVPVTITQCVCVNGIRYRCGLGGL